MDETLGRLKDTTSHAIATFEAWSKKRNDPALTETAGEVVHELRKVAARLEVELITAEREELSQAPIPIPAHRANPRRDQIDETSS